MKRYIIPYLIVVFTLIGLIILVWRLPAKISLPAKEAKQWSAEDQLEYANTLLAKGLNKEAALAFEDYISESGANKKELARVCYRLGNIYMDSYEYEKALGAFYKAEILDNESDFKNELNQKIVKALEKLGMSSQAQYELEARTALGKPLKKEGRIVARIGKEEVSETEINKAIDRLPPALRKDLQAKEKRRDFIRQYVGYEALYRKAKRLGLDKNPQIREDIETFKKQRVVEQLLKERIDKELKITPQDLELYYKANKEKYIEPEAIKVSYVEVEDESKKEEAQTLLKEKKGKRIEQWIQKDQSYLPGIGEAKDIIADLFLKQEGQFSDPLKIKDKLYIFLIDKKRAQRQKDFSEVKNQVEYEYKMKKQKELTRSLLEKALEEQEVEFFYQPAPQEHKQGANEADSKAD
jgi:parvulin-like peptidyl-prolyl isomerase